MGKNKIDRAVVGRLWKRQIGEVKSTLSQLPSRIADALPAQVTNATRARIDKSVTDELDRFYRSIDAIHLAGDEPNQEL